MIIVIGKNGLLAQEIKYCSDSLPILFFGRNDINLLCKDSLYKVLNSYSPKAIVNTAAWTNVVSAEEEIDSVFALNHLAVLNLAQYCNDKSVRFLHISSDYVFDGTKKEPYKINDIPNPINIYGRSKLAAEESIFEFKNSEFSVIRTSWLYSVFGNNFLKKMLNLMQNNEKINVVSDEKGGPTYARDLAKFILEIISISKLERIYHWRDYGIASRYELALEIYIQAKRLGLITTEVTINKISTAEFNKNFLNPPIRPLNNILEQYPINNNHWKDNVRSVLESLSMTSSLN